MNRRTFSLLLALALLPAPTRAADQWVVVTAPAFRSAIEPLVKHRKGQGMQVYVVETTDVLGPAEVRDRDGRKLRDHVQKLCGNFKGKSYLLLVGALDATGAPAPGQTVLPALAGTAGRMRGQPSDNGYGCRGDDLMPAVAVGRFPARTAEEARGMVQKTLAYERDPLPGEWRRRLTVLAGIPAFNPVVDKLVETLALARFDRIDPAWTGRAIYHNPQSRFSLPDDQLHERAVQYVEEGQAFTLYLGHSDALGFYAGPARFMDRTDWGRLRIARGNGIFATFGCLGCQLRGRGGEGYGLAAIRNPSGPAAVIGSHGVCFAAMVNLAADALFENLLTGRTPERLGDGWLALKAGVARGKIDPITYQLLDAVDGDSRIPQAVQRQEHLEMFLLLGDPALRLPALAADVRLTLPEVVNPGQEIAVRGELPARLAGARVRVTLERTVSSVPADLEPLPKDPPGRDRVMRANHDKANRFVLDQRVVTAEQGRFVARLTAPAKLPWPRLIVRAYAATEKQEGIGVGRVSVKRD